MEGHIKWKPVPNEIEQLKQKVFGIKSVCLNGILSEPYGLHAPKTMKDIAKEVFNFETRADDIWIVTFPKCGTTLTQVSEINSQDSF